MNDQRKEQLIQQYEEVALALLMDEYADAEGARLLQKFEAALQQGNIAPMPEDLDAKCQKLIDQAYGKSRRRNLVSQIAKAVGKVAVVVLVLFGLTSVTILSVDAWRIPVLNFILDESGDHASLNFKNTDNETKDKFTEIINDAVGIVPVGYELINQPAVDNAVLSIRFQNAEGNRILITVRQSTSDLVVDTENAEYIGLEVAGHRAFLLQKEDLYIIWYGEVERFVYEVYSNGLSADEFWNLVYSLAE